MKSVPSPGSPSQTPSSSPSEASCCLLCSFTFSCSFVRILWSWPSFSDRLLPVANAPSGTIAVLSVCGISEALTSMFASSVPSVIFWAAISICFCSWLIFSIISFSCLVLGPRCFGRALSSCLRFSTCWNREPWLSFCVCWLLGLSSFSDLSEDSVLTLSENKLFSTTFLFLFVSRFSPFFPFTEYT